MLQKLTFVFPLNHNLQIYIPTSTMYQFSYSVNKECWWSFLHSWSHYVFQFIIHGKINTFNSLFNHRKKIAECQITWYRGCRINSNFNFTITLVVACNMYGWALSCSRIISTMDCWTWHTHTSSKVFWLYESHRI